MSYLLHQKNFNKHLEKQNIVKDAQHLLTFYTMEQIHKQVDCPISVRISQALPHVCWLLSQ